MLNWVKSQAIRAKLLNDPFCRLQSVTEIQVAAELGIKIDVNQATVDDWLRLPGISIHQARSLVELVAMGVQLLCLEDIASALSLPVARIKPWEPILDFCYYPTESLITPKKLNPNLATIAQLTEITIIDNTLANLIVENRSVDPYRNLADLQRRLGLDAKLTSQLMYYLQF